VQVDTETLLLEQEGGVLPIGGKSGTQPLRNPRADLLNALHSQVTMAFRALSLHGSPTDKRVLHRGAKAESTARAAIQRAAEYDDLLA
jgi:hypothetical protein